MSLTSQDTHHPTAPEWRSRAGLGVVTGFNQEPRSIGKFLVLRQVWSQAGKSIHRFRSASGPAMAARVRTQLNDFRAGPQWWHRSKVSLRVSPDQQDPWPGRVTAVVKLAFLQQRLKAAEWPEMGILGPWAGDVDGGPGEAGQGQ